MFLYITFIYFFSFKKALIIHKEKRKKLMLNEALISDDTAKLYVQFFTQNNPKSKYYYTMV